MRDLSRIRQAVFSEPWAILEEKMDAIVGLLEGATAEIVSSAAAAMRDNNSKRELERISGIPVVPVIGVISKRMNLFSDISGGTSIEVIGRQFDEALAMDAPAVILNFDTPGGAVAGVPEFATRIYEAAAFGPKPIIAFCEFCCSAGYWMASQCNAVYASEAADVGSIGVIARYMDNTRMMQNAGVDPVIIRSSELKAPGVGPMTPNQQSSVRSQVAKIHGMFKDAVVRGRPDIDIEAVGNGATWIGQSAVEAGLVDGISTIERVAAMYGTKKTR